MTFSITALQNLLQTWGYLAVFVFVLIESSGIPFPGETMLVTAAAYAGAGHLRIQLVIAAAITGAILGDNLGYLVGRTGGRALVERYGKYVRLDSSKLSVAEAFFDRHGDKTVFLGRFVAVLRAWAAFLAGLNRMNWGVFIAFNAAGAIVWCILYGTVAFELGKNLSLLHSVVRWLGIAGIAVAGIAAVGGYLYYRRQRIKHSQGRTRVDDKTGETRAASGE